MVPCLHLCYEDYPWIQKLAPHAEDGTTKMSVTHLVLEHGFNDEHRQGGSVGSAGASGLAVSLAFFRNAAYDVRELEKSMAKEEEWKYRPENQESDAMLQLLKTDVHKWALRGRGAVYR